MNFFERQRDVRGASRRLVVLFALAVVAIVAVLDLVVAGALELAGRPSLAVLAWVSGLAVTGMVLTSLVRTRLLRAGGGGRVAERLGGRHVGPDTTDPRARRLRTVVEETAVATGVPVPQVYVLPDEPGVTAFTAGFSAADAAVAVTRGALEQLTDEDLRGVVAHELSHVVDGDMRLNTRLMGVLSGILGVAVLGRRLSVRGGPVAVLGLVLIVLGSLGVFLGRVIKAAVCGRRMSDKVAGLDSRLRAGRAEEVSHMLSGSPVASRPQSPADEPDQAAPLPDPAARVPVAPADVVASVGMVAPPAEPVLRHVPEPLLARARDPETAPRLVFGLLLAADRHARTNQHKVLASRYGQAFADAVVVEAGELAGLHPALRLPLAEVAFPALRRRPRAARERALAALHRLAGVDGRLELFEYCLTRLLHRELSEHLARRRPPREVANRAVATLLAVLAEAGGADPRDAGLAYQTGLAQVVPGEPIPYDPPAAGATALEGLWPALDGVPGPEKESLIGAMVTVIGRDGEMTVSEVELLRTVCALLHCPLPPLTQTRPEQVAP